MEELQTKHRKELKDLQARITQKKKQASKKTRKGVNDECDRLEQETKDRQAAEVSALYGGSGLDEQAVEDKDNLANGTSSLSLEDKIAPTAPNNEEVVPAAGHHLKAGDAATEPPKSEDNSFQQKKPNRARARMERRKAEQEALFNQASQEASDLPDLKAQERERMIREFKSRGLVEKEIRADGHCLYSAFADQMEVLGVPLGSAPTEKPSLMQTLSNGLKRESLEEQQAKQERYRLVRKSAAEYIESHSDDFAPFLEEPLPVYIHKVRDTGEWGGQLELLALAKTYGVQINVLQGDGRVEEIFPEDLQDPQKAWLAYYRHGFGLGEHYNSLRKAP